MAPDPVFPYSSEEKEHCLDPLLNMMLALRRQEKTTIIGIQGGQGTGKTRLSSYLVGRLSAEGHRAVSFSIDDFYKSYEDRRHLAARHPGNPYYQLPRGMPGTHRTASLYEALSRFKGGEDVDLPVFSKAAHQAHGDIEDFVVPVRGRREFILFEGWCVGMPPATPEELIDLCRRQHLLDPSPLAEAEHLRAVLEHVRPYQRIWKLIDFFVMLRPDSSLLHEVWRLEQERDLIAQTGVGMPEEQVRELVRHFLPFTYLCYEKIAPDMLIRIDTGHRFHGIIAPKRSIDRTR